MLADTLATNVYLPAWDRWRGSNAGRYRAEVQSVLSGNSKHVREFQLRRLRDICRYAYENTDFYRQRFDELGIHSFDRFSLEEFRRIPTLTKTDIRERLSALLSKRHSAAKRYKSATGGTTSSPVMFYMDWPALDRRWAATHEWDRRIGYERGQKIACLWGAQQDFNSAASWREKWLSRYVTRTKFLASSPLDDGILGGYYETLARWKPKFLQAYPTPLAIFADFLVRNQLRLNIQNISVTAEPLLRSQIEVITEAFGCRPYNWYGSRESGRIATECECHAGMHVNVYGVFVEIDGQGDYPDSSMGRIVITDLWNVAMPMIRYEIGDVGTMTYELCQCGSELPRLTSLEGRTTDAFINSAGQRVPGVAFTNRIVKDDSTVREMQIIQRAVGQFEVLVIPGMSWHGERSKQEIARKVGEFMQESTETIVSVVDSIPREPSGKVRFCKCLIDANRPLQG